MQVNHGWQPDCANFGVPVRTEPGKTDPSADRGMNRKRPRHSIGLLRAIEH